MKECKVVVFEYSSEFMNIYKLIRFAENLKEYKKTNNFFKIVFYGDYTDEEFAVNMTYFNRFVKDKVCDFAISVKSKNIVFENGINNKQIATEVTNITKEDFKGTIYEYYKENNIKIIAASNTSWESIFSKI